MLQRSIGMSYLDTNQLQMRTVQYTEAVAVHRIKTGEKKSMNKCLNLSTPREDLYLALHFLIKITLKKEKLYEES